MNSPILNAFYALVITLTICGLIIYFSERT